MPGAERFPCSSSFRFQNNGTSRHSLITKVNWAAIKPGISQKNPAMLQIFWIKIDFMAPHGVPAASPQRVVCSENRTNGLDYRTAYTQTGTRMNLQLSTGNRAEMP